MMRNLIELISAMMLTLLLITSCSKNDEEVTKLVYQSENVIIEEEMHNPANPYDEQGRVYIGFLKALAEDGDIGDWDIGQLARFNADMEAWDVRQISQDQPENAWDVGWLSNFAMVFNEFKGKDSGGRARFLSIQLEAFRNMNRMIPRHKCQVYLGLCPGFDRAMKSLELSSGGSARDLR